MIPKIFLVLLLFVRRCPGEVIQVKEQCKSSCPVGKEKVGDVDEQDLDLLSSPLANRRGR